MTTGERIRQLRVEHQMTQEELGAKVGVQKAAIYKYENGLGRKSQALDTRKAGSRTGNHTNLPHGDGGFR